jgi:hypothetical protein
MRNSAADTLRSGAPSMRSPVGGDPFFSELQEVYDAIGEALPAGAPQPAPGELADQRAEIDESGLFDTVTVEHLAWTVDYTAGTYIDLLRTFSGDIAMTPADREHLFAEIRQPLARRPSGTARRGWGTVLHIARKRHNRA